MTGSGAGGLQALWVRAERRAGLSCRWLAQNGEWAFPLVTGLLFVLTVFSLVSLNFSDPGILHQGEALGLRRGWPVLGLLPPPASASAPFPAHPHMPGPRLWHFLL